jgi:predicted RNA-binding protein with PUA-like domain
MKGGVSEVRLGTLSEPPGAGITRSTLTLLEHPLAANYWLMKSEPESYSIDRFKADKKTLWTGVRNYQARNYMVDQMKPGDLFFFYHSNAEPTAIVGVGRIVKVNQPDPSALDPKSEYYDPKASTDRPIWMCAEVAFEEKWPEPVTLAELKADAPKSLSKRNGRSR